MDTKEMQKHIDELDGLRALALGMVVWFHFWQQSWITPYVRVPLFLQTLLGITRFDLEGFVRCGYLFVDLLILLSAFCNFYPYALSIVCGADWPDTKTFYRRRFFRIVPSYLLAITVMMIVGLLEHDYHSPGFFVKDLLSHLTCTSTFFTDVFFGSPITGVLWTVQLEFLYYLLIPWIARLFRRLPALTCFWLWSVSFIAVRYYTFFFPEQARTANNHPFTYACCYANGLLLCVLYCRLREISQKESCVRLVSTLLFFGCFFRLDRLVQELLHLPSDTPLWVVQIGQRMELSFLFSCLLLSLLLSAKWLRAFFSCMVLRFFSAISYNLYIWHQYISVKLKAHRIPYWEGDTPPNMLGDRAWMWKYQILTLLLSILVAAVLTYGFERPIFRRFLGPRKPKAIDAPQEPDTSQASQSPCR